VRWLDTAFVFGFRLRSFARIQRQRWLIPPITKTKAVSSHRTPKRPSMSRTWKDKFADAFRGLKFGTRGQSSFAVHFFAAATVITSAAVLHCSLEEWALLIFAIGLVLTTELVNSALETLFRGLDPETRESSWKSLDIAAAAVLVASITAALIGMLVFGRRIADMMG
jgi:diacylglycerol kinase